MTRDDKLKAATLVSAVLALAVTGGLWLNIELRKTSPVLHQPPHNSVAGPTTATHIDNNIDVTPPASPDDKDCDHPECDPVDTMIMERVRTYLGFDADSAYMVSSDDRYSARDETNVRQRQDRIEQLQHWVDALPGGRVRLAYDHWVDFYRHGENEAMHEMQTREKKTKDEADERKARECNEYARQYATTHNIPTPPRTP